MGSSEKFCLRWNDFERNISSAFYDFKEEKDFADVTLACADGQVESHKVILAASSPFFKRILKKNPHSHPLIYLKGIKLSDVEAVLNYMYHGEVNVEEANLNTFLMVTEELEVKGLVQDQGKRDLAGGGSNMQPQSPSLKTTLQSPAFKSTQQFSNLGSNMQSSAQMHGHGLPCSQYRQELSSSVNNNKDVHVKVESEETFLAPASEDEQQQYGRLNHPQEQCSQFCFKQFCNTGCKQMNDPNNSSLLFIVPNSKLMFNINVIDLTDQLLIRKRRWLVLI